MADNKPSFKKFMTVAGIAVYPKLNAPDFKFKKENGEFGVKLRLNADDSAAFIAKIEAELAAYWPTAKAELQKAVDDAKTGPAKAKAKLALAEIKEADKGYKPAYDDEGNETGEYEFNIKMPAQFTASRGAKMGQIVKMKPDVFDSKGKKLDTVPEIWGGSKLIIAGEFRPFSMPIGVGVSLRLKAAQIIELVQGGGNRDAGSYGFGQEEGFEGSDEPTMGDHAPTEGAAPAGADEEF